MSKLVIKKHVSLDFLGEEYKDAYINFRSVPISDFEKIHSDMKASKEDTLAAAFLAPFLKTYFLDGKFPVDGELQDLQKDDLDGLDASSVLECWKGISGQDLEAAMQRAQETGEPGGVTIDPKSPSS